MERQTCHSIQDLKRRPWNRPRIPVAGPGRRALKARSASQNCPQLYQGRAEALGKPSTKTSGGPSRSPLHSLSPLEGARGPLVNLWPLSLIKKVKRHGARAMADNLLKPIHSPAAQSKELTARAEQKQNEVWRCNFGPKERPAAFGWHDVSYDERNESGALRSLVW